jgi:hypothetical protein
LLAGPGEERKFNGEMLSQKRLRNNTNAEFIVGVTRHKRKGAMKERPSDLVLRNSEKD